MSFGFSEVAEYIALGVILSLIFYLLRGSIDRRKGVLVEAAAVTFPIATAAGILKMMLPDQSWLVFGSLLSLVVQAVFVALPVFVAARLIERRRLGEKLQLADLFRITTVTSLVAFVFSSLAVSDSGFLLVICLCTFIAGEWAADSRARGSNLAVIFVFGFIAMAVLCIVFEVRLTLLQRPSTWTLLDSAAISEGTAMIALVLPQALVSICMESTFLNSTWFPQIALRVARWRQSIGRAEDLIYVRTVFDLWRFRRNVVYLNHGSFGAVPIILQHQQKQVRQSCESEPMDFLARKLEPLWFDARFKLAVWLGTQPENIAFCENATAGMNEIASWFPLAAGDEVLMNDHEYGAVRRIWKRRCEASGAKLVEVTLPLPLTDPQQITDAILAGCSERTRLVILSHITSPTAIVLPVEEICPQLRSRGIASCIDGPHALLQETFKLYNLQCDFYTASCHKWLCAPIGSGFVYVDPRWHSQCQPARLSWGRLNPAKPEKWSDELLWTGTRDYSAYLTVPRAIEFFAKFDREKLDARNHALACYARRRLSELPGAEPVTPEGREWFGWMVGVWLPSNYNQCQTLQQRLWERYRIEVPIVHFAGRYLVRVSCHLYVSTHDIDTLVRCLQQELQVNS
jgi:isopenicillin-N epimerase